MCFPYKFPFSSTNLWSVFWELIKRQLARGIRFHLAFQTCSNQFRLFWVPSTAGGFLWYQLMAQLMLTSGFPLWIPPIRSCNVCWEWGAPGSAAMDSHPPWAMFTEEFLGAGLSESDSCWTNVTSRGKSGVSHQIQREVRSDKSLDCILNLCKCGGVLSRGRQPVPPPHHRITLLRFTFMVIIGCKNAQIAQLFCQDDIVHCKMEPVLPKEGLVVFQFTSYEQLATFCYFCLIWGLTGHELPRTLFRDHEFHSYSNSELCHFGKK